MLQNSMPSYALLDGTTLPERQLSMPVSRVQSRIDWPRLTQTWIPTMRLSLQRSRSINACTNENRKSVSNKNLYHNALSSGRLFRHPPRTRLLLQQVQFMSLSRPPRKCIAEKTTSVCIVESLDISRRNAQQRNPELQRLQLLPRRTNSQKTSCSSRCVRSTAGNSQDTNCVVAFHNTCSYLSRQQTENQFEHPSLIGLWIDFEHHIT
jgi:hypothetical protein